MVYNLLANGIDWGYSPFSNHLLTSWDILVGKQKALAVILLFSGFVLLLLLCECRGCSRPGNLLGPKNPDIEKNIYNSTRIG